MTDPRVRGHPHALARGRMRPAKGGLEPPYSVDRDVEIVLPAFKRDRGSVRVSVKVRQRVKLVVEPLRVGVRLALVEQR